MPTSRAPERAASCITPTFFINGRRYDGPWDESSFADAMLGLARAPRPRRGARLRELGAVGRRPAPARDRSSPIALTNSALGAGVRGVLGTEIRLFAGRLAAFRMSLRHWVNDGSAHALLPRRRPRDQARIHRWSPRHAGARRRCRSQRRSAAWWCRRLLTSLLIPAGGWSHGWGVPMATDTAFAVALIAMMGHRVPIELRIFLTAAAIVDDIGAIIVVALFYSDELHLGYLAAAAVIVAGGSRCSMRAHVYRVTPYVCSASRSVALRARRRTARDAGRRPSRDVHSDPTAAEPAMRSWRRPTRSSPPKRSRAARCCATARRSRAARARRHPRPARVAGRPHACATSARARATWSCPLFALANAGVALTLGVLDGREPLAARDRRRPRDRQAARHRCSPPRSRCVSASPSSPTNIRGGRSRAPARSAGIGFTMSLVHRRPGVPGRSRLRRGEDRRIRRVGDLGGDRRRGVVGTPPRRRTRRQPCLTTRLPAQLATSRSTSSRHRID